MTYSIPQLTLFQNPSHFSPVYSQNWFAFTCSYTASTTATNINLISDVNILQQTTQLDTLLENAGRFKVPMRNSNTFVFNPEQVLKSYITYPYNNGDVVYYADWGTSSTTTSTGSAHYVNECVGFGTPSYRYPTIAPEMDGIVKYNLSYGLQWEPGVTMSRLTSAVTGGITYSAFWAYGQTNLFAEEGDIVDITMDSGLFSYYNGTASILFIDVVFGNTYFITDQLFSTALFNITEFPTGKVNTTTHIYGTSSTFYAYNGTRQFIEKDVNFDNILYFREAATASVGFPNKKYPPAPLTMFMNDWGKTYQQAIPIRQGQCERARFLADMWDFISVPQYASNRLSKYTIETFDQNLNFIGTQSIALRDGEALGRPFPQKCFTIQLFDFNSTIVGGYYYKFTLYGYATTGPLFFPYTSIWYKGLDSCSRYTNYRIKFLNRFGTWCYWNFNKDNKQTTNINREYYNSPIFYDQTMITGESGLSSQPSPFRLSKLRGQNVLNIEANDTYVLNSDWLSEAEYNYLQQLVTSTQVFIFYDTYTLPDGTDLTAVNIPIIITDTSYLYKTVNREQIFNLVLTYKNAFNQSITNP